MTIYQGLGENVTVIFPPDRTSDGTYELPSGQIHIHPFTIGSGDAIEIPAMQLPGRVSYAVRAWVGDDPMGTSEFFRFHPSEGGIAHIFYDESITPAPTGITSPIQQNKFNGMTYQFRAIQVPLPLDEYFYHVKNLENQTVYYKIGFTATTPIPSDDGPCAPFN